jgi:hypothetical protein
MQIAIVSALQFLSSTATSPTLSQSDNHGVVCRRQPGREADRMVPRELGRQESNRAENARRVTIGLNSFEYHGNAALSRHRPVHGVGHRLVDATDVSDADAQDHDDPRISSAEAGRLFLVSLPRVQSIVF